MTLAIAPASWAERGPRSLARNSDNTARRDMTSVIPGPARFASDARKPPSDGSILKMSLMDSSILGRFAEENHERFVEAKPFPHIVIDDFLPEEVAEGLLHDFSQQDSGWKHDHHYNERKSAITELVVMPVHTRRVFEVLLSQDTIDFIAKLTGIEGLVADPDLEGVGMQRALPGGFLNIHTDFLTHTKKRSWRREINLLIYLNKDWKVDWNGNLELWDKQMTRCETSVPPAFNRCVIFDTIPGSYHGHPIPLACPPGETRKHILLYDYRDEGHPLAIASTEYRARPQDSLGKKAMIGLDAAVLRLYTAIKGRTGISDRMLDRILRYF